MPFSLPGFEIQQVTVVEKTLIITAVAVSEAVICPSCGKARKRIHSYYLRKPQDLPSSGHSIPLHLQVRRFRCQNGECSRQTFSERLPEIVAVWVRRTFRLSSVLKIFAVALSGQLASHLLDKLGMPTSADSLLRLVKRGVVPETAPPRLSASMILLGVGGRRMVISTSRLAYLQC